MNAIKFKGGEINIAGNQDDYTQTSSRVDCIDGRYGPTNLLLMDESRIIMKNDDAKSPEVFLIGGIIQSNKNNCC